MQQVRIVVIDDQTILREMLVEILVAEDGLVVLGQYDNGMEGLARCLELRPDLVVLDIMLPDLNGIDVLRRLSSELPKTGVVIITAHERPDIIREAVDAGARGIVMKGAPLREFREAVRRVSEGRSYLCTQTSELMEHQSMDIGLGADTQLTGRERQVVQLVASGLSTKEIAQKLSLSTKTVSNHRHNLMQKLGLHDVASLTRYAIDRGLVEAKV